MYAVLFLTCFALTCLALTCLALSNIITTH
jgi:hypothetical protein